MSKHKARRERRERYFDYLKVELSDPKRFKQRVISTIDQGGMDTAPDGRPIKANFWGFIKAQEKADQPTSLACLDLMEQSVKQISVTPIPRR